MPDIDPTPTPETQPTEPPPADPSPPPPIVYATVQSFGGQRASLGRTVLACLPRPHRELRPAVIESIDVTHDVPNLRLTDHLLMPGVLLTFRATTAETIGELAAGEWTWPPRV